LHPYLQSLGANQLLDRSELATTSARPLESERWGGAIDSVGGTTLATLLKTMAYGASVAACGLAGGAELPTTVLPFILRGVNLLGIESVAYPRPKRIIAWERLADELPLHLLDQMIEVVPLGQAPAVCAAIMAGQVRGRTVIDVNA
jgi:acrylyl-CoA reductase (NADPH)